MRPVFFFFPLWRQIFWFSYGAWILFEIWVFSRDHRAVHGQRQDRGTLHVLIALICIAIMIVFTAPLAAPWARISFPSRPLFAAATILIWAGIGLRLWAIQTLGGFFRVTVLMHDEHRLVTAGPYRILRHPAYAGSLMTIAGIALFMANWLSLVGTMAFALCAYAIRIRVEEKALFLRFGLLFEQQRARSWAIIPFLW